MKWRLGVPPEIDRELWNKDRGALWAEIPKPLLAGSDRAQDYDPDVKLIDAANVAIELGQPLLLMGEPGSGKTSFADHVAWQIGLDRALRYQVRTDMDARDMFYRYDNMARFRATHEDAKSSPENFLTLNALGEAIVRAADPEVYGELRQRLLPGIGDDCRRAVVLIDEIDKAPRDVPNDLLGYVTAEQIWFNVPELGGRDGARNKIVACSEMQPIIVCTSNSEKSLPDAFLRRCVVYEIEVPQGDALAKIIFRRVTDLPVGSLLSRDITELAKVIRDAGPMKKPGIAEVLGFALALLRNGYTKDKKLERNGEAPWKPIAKMTLLKLGEDQRRIDEMCDGFG